PTTTRVSSAFPASRRKWSEARRIFELKAPQSPRSEVMTTSRCRVPTCRVSNGCRSPSARITRVDISSAIFVAYGRAASTRSCARLSLAAATSFIARVIFWVDWTERILRRMSLRVAMPSSGSGGLDAPAHRELGLGLVDRFREPIAQLVGQLLLVRDLREELAVLPVQERLQELLEGLDL